MAQRYQFASPPPRSACPGRGGAGFRTRDLRFWGRGGIPLGDWVMRGPQKRTQTKHAGSLPLKLCSLACLLRSGAQEQRLVPWDSETVHTSQRSDHDHALPLGRLKALAAAAVAGAGLEVSSAAELQNRSTPQVLLSLRKRPASEGYEASLSSQGQEGAE